MTLHQVRQFALSLPQTAEEPHFHLTSFRVRGKIFATAPLDGEYLHVFIPEELREAALSAEPDFLEELSWGKRIVGVRAILASAKAGVVNQLLSQAWSSKAPKKLLASLRGATSGQAAELPVVIRGRPHDRSRE
jgi:hypothetical protein